MNRMASAVAALLVAGAAGNAAWGQQEYGSGTGRTGIGATRAKGADDWDFTIRAVFGVKVLDEAEWAPADAQSEISFVTDFAPKSWPVRLAVDFRYASESATVTDGFNTFDFETATAELDLGVRKYWWLGSSATFSVGGGLCLGWAEAGLDGSGGGVSESDYGVGLWLGLGLEFNLGGGFTLGVELGSSAYDVEIFDSGFNGGGTRLGFSIGWTF